MTRDGVPMERDVIYSVTISTKPNGMDHEVAMIALAVQAINHLDHDARARAARYLSRRYDFGGAA